MPKQYRKIWLDELELNSHLFSTVVISEHSTRKQAFEAELALQLLVGVPKSPLFINKALASSSFMFGGEHTEETKEKLVGEGVGFERIRRITGYLVGTVDRFNNGKRAEERDRVKHGTEGLLSNK